MLVAIAGGDIAVSVAVFGEFNRWPDGPQVNYFHFFGSGVLVVRKTLLSMMAVALMLSGAGHLSAEDKPIAVVSVASYETFQKDLKFIGELAGAPELDKSLDGMVALVTGGKGLTGLDKSRPMGAAFTLEGMTPHGFAFLPITDLKSFLALFPQISPQESGGVYEVQGPGGQSVYAAQKGKWAFVSNDKDVLGTVPADPEKLLGNLTKDYAVAVQFNVQNVPEDMRNTFVQMFQAGAEASMQQNPGEDDIAFELRKKILTGQLKQMDSLVKGLNEFTIGWAIDPTARNTHLDMSLTAVSGSDIAKQFAKAADVKSEFGGFLLPDAAVTFNACSKMDQSDIDQIVGMLNEFRKKASQGIANDANIPDKDGKDAANEVVGQLFDVATNTVKSGKLDFGGALVLQPNSLAFAAGGFVKDGAAFDAAVRKLVELGKADKDFPEVKFDAETYKGIKVHSIAIPAPDENAKRLFGDNINAYLGIGQQSVYFCLGKEGLTTLKSIVDKSAAPSSGVNYPFQLNFALTQIAQFINSTKPNPQAAMAAQLLSSAPGKDHIRITASVISNGVNYRIEAEEGVLKAIGTIAKLMGGGMRGQPGNF
jgi:hypothetical protein